MNVPTIGPKNFVVVGQYNRRPAVNLPSSSTDGYAGSSLVVADDLYRGKTAYSLTGLPPEMRKTAILLDEVTCGVLSGIGAPFVACAYGA